MSAAAAPLLQSSTALILASASPSRAAILTNAGLAFDIHPAAIDENAVRQALKADGAMPEPSDVAEILARAKAETVSAQHPAAVVIGADQVLAVDGELLSKPADMEEARSVLLRLKGRAHQLHAVVCVARGGETLWAQADTASLTMRPLSPKFVGIYLAAAGDAVLSSVGAYQIEGLGIHLFSEIDGDFFTVLGLPLLPLLDCLRREGVLIS